MTGPTGVTPIADIVLPCLDEARALPWVLGRIPPGWRAIVVDNGSSDGSAAIAAGLGAAVSAEGAPAGTFAAVLAAPADPRVLVLDGVPGPWLPPDIDAVPQAEGGFDDRLAAALGQCDGPTLLIGVDTPQLTPALLRPALEPTSREGARRGSARPRTAGSERRAWPIPIRRW